MSHLPVKPSNGVTGRYSEKISTRTECLLKSQGETTVPAWSTQSMTGSPRAGTSFFCTAENGRRFGAATRCAGKRIRCDARVDARHPSDLASRLRDTIELVDGHPEIDHAHQDRKEDDDRERELDKALPFLPARRPHGTDTVCVVVIEQAALVAVSVTDCEPSGGEVVVLQVLAGARSLRPTRPMSTRWNCRTRCPSRSIRCGLPRLDLSVATKVTDGHTGGGPPPVTVMTWTSVSVWPRLSVTGQGHREAPGRRVGVRRGHAGGAEAPGIPRDGGARRRRCGSVEVDGQGCSAGHRVGDECGRRGGEGWERDGRHDETLRLGLCAEDEVVADDRSDDGCHDPERRRDRHRDGRWCA